MARRRSAETDVQTTAEAVVEESKPKVRKVEPKECGCGCGAMTRGGTFVIGHDMRKKSSLLKAFDAGDEAAGRELVERGWRTEESLAARKVDGPAARKAASAQERRAAKIAKLLDHIAALVDERDALLAEAEAEGEAA